MPLNFLNKLLKEKRTNFILSLGTFTLNQLITPFARSILNIGHIFEMTTLYEVKILSPSGNEA